MGVDAVGRAGDERAEILAGLDLQRRDVLRLAHALSGHEQDHRADEQDRDRAPERPVISAFVAQPPALVCKLLRGRQVDGPVFACS